MTCLCIVGNIYTYCFYKQRRSLITCTFSPSSVTTSMEFGISPTLYCLVIFVTFDNEIASYNEKRTRGASGTFIRRICDSGVVKVAMEWEGGDGYSYV